MGTGSYARYELRDNAGLPVDAFAVPVCPTLGDCYDSTFGSLDAECASIVFVGQQRVGLQFQLSSGDPEPCYENQATWQDFSGFFFDDQCTQPAALANGTVYRVGGVLYYGPLAGASLPASLYAYSPTNMTCGPTSSLPDTFLFSPPQPVPVSVLNALPDAPYELALAY